MSCNSSNCLVIPSRLSRDAAIFHPAQRRHLAAQFGHFVLHRFGLRRPRRALFGRGTGDVVIVDAGKVRLNPVVVALAKRIEFVIVAARAAERDPQHCRAHHVRHLGEHLIAAAGDFLIAGVLAQRSQAVEAGGDQRFVFLGRNLIAGELFGDEAVVRLVIVERADDVVAIAPGVIAVRIVLEAIGFGEAHDVEPMLSPSLAVVRAGEQFFD